MAISQLNKETYQCAKLVNESFNKGKETVYINITDMEFKRLYFQLPINKKTPKKGSDLGLLRTKIDKDVHGFAEISKDKVMSLLIKQKSDFEDLGIYNETNQIEFIIQNLINNSETNLIYRYY